MSAALVIDTHILVWLRSEDRELTRQERSTLDSAERRFISMVSFWELGTLTRLGKVDRDRDWFSVPEGFALLQVGMNHCKELAVLPLHHRDPFDRMLVAQARIEGLGILTRDGHISRYGRERDGLLIPD